jgi:hypothetical protein
VIHGRQGGETLRQAARANERGVVCGQRICGDADCVAWGSGSSRT